VVDARQGGGVGSPQGSDSPLAHICRTDQVVSFAHTNRSRIGGCGRPVSRASSAASLA